MSTATIPWKSPASRNESSPVENSTQRFFRHYRGLPWYDKASLALATFLGAGLFLVLSPLFLFSALFLRR